MLVAGPEVPGATEGRSAAAQRARQLEHGHVRNRRSLQLSRLDALQAVGTSADDALPARTPSARAKDGDGNSILASGNAESSGPISARATKVVSVFVSTLPQPNPRAIAHARAPGLII